MASGHQFSHFSGQNTCCLPISSHADHSVVSQKSTSFWCIVTYFEQSLKIGDAWRASGPSITIDGFTDTSDSKRFCLGHLNNPHRSLSAENARRFIGKGVKLTYNGQDVNAENLSDSPVFVQSTLMNLQCNRNPSEVIKIPPQGTLRIFGNREFGALLVQASDKDYESIYRMTRMCSIHMSFVEGWGVDLSKPSVTSTPCWIEIKLEAPLKWLDILLAEKGQPPSRCSSR
ncbi:mothers against decapentaplegic homolog 2-like [Crassostrea angulata]|uniref:mothers against decapentaplegic homolog 2-like n=1 Tax=Magallana angulata TaxID=2784310 RepID=UPI0022B17090|nr:mothers against decapentaplegic homolog 2-like [Crassostrea angulata]